MIAALAIPLSAYAATLAVAYRMLTRVDTPLSDPPQIHTEHD